MKFDPTCQQRNLSSTMALMLSSHLPRTPCDKFVYDFLCGFSGIVAGSGLRRMCSHCLRASCDFLYGPSGASWDDPYRVCAEIVRKSCNLSGFAVKSPQPPDSNRTEPVRLPYRGCAEMVLWSWLHHAMFERAASALCPCRDCAMPPTTCLRATDLRFFKLV